MEVASVEPSLVIEDPVTQNKTYKPALIVLAVLYFMMGLITCLNDTLIPFFKKGFSLTYAQSSFVQLYFFITYAVFSIPASMLVEKIGYKKGMVIGFAVASLGAALFFPAAELHRYGVFLLALFVIAIGIVTLQVAANPYVTTIGSPKTASSRLNMVQALGALGTTVAPIIGSYFILSSIQTSSITSEAVKYPYVVIASVLAIISLVVGVLPLPNIQFSKSNDAQGIWAALKFRNLKFGVFAIFMYVGAEVSIGSFLANYISDTLSIDIQHANYYVSFYWGGMLVGRLLGSFILTYLQPWKLLAAASFTAILLIVVSINSTGPVAVWSMVLVGLNNSIMFGIIFSLGVHGLGGLTTKASGLLSTAIIGGAVISFCQGILKDHFSWLVSYVAPISCYLFILFYGLSGYKPKRKLVLESADK